MRLAMVAAKFTGPEANELRRAMATFRRRGTIDRLHEKMVGRMTARGYPTEFAERCFNQIKGFGEYGFPESHAASFAHLVYVSAWIKCHYPAAFAAALLNAQPMGFYAPAQIVRCARDHGVEAREADVNLSLWDCTLEPTRAQVARSAVAQTKNSCRAPPRHAPDRRAARGRRAAPCLGTRRRSRQDLQRRSRSVAAERAEARKPGETRRSRCLPLARARPPPGALGGARSAQGTAAAAVRTRRFRRCRRRASRHAANHAPLRACGERLPHAQAFPQSSSDELPPRPHKSRALLCLRRSQIHARRGAGERRRRRACASAPRLGARRGVHDHRGRDGSRQFGDLAQGARARAEGGDGRAARRGAWPHPAP